MLNLNILMTDSWRMQWLEYWKYIQTPWYEATIANAFSKIKWTAESIHFQQRLQNSFRTFFTHKLHTYQIYMLCSQDMWNSIFLGHGSSKRIDLPVTLSINISAALSMCVNHDHFHSIEMKHSRRKKETQTMQASTDANSEDCLSIKNTYNII